MSRLLRAATRANLRRLMDFVGILTSPESWVALATLALLEIVLGIDNLVFIAILTGRLPRAERTIAYRLGLAGAMVTRILLLLGLSWVMHLNHPLFTVFDHAISGRDLILLIGGIFLIGKSAHEIYEKVEVDDEDEEGGSRSRANLWATIAQIWVMDIIFSLDSVVTAVGMVDEVAIMIVAIMIAVGIMVIFAGRIGEFINRHPSMKILALSFMLLIGVLLVAEGFGQHISKGYIYAAMGFAFFVELINMRFRKKIKTPVAGAEKIVPARQSRPGE